MFRPGNAASNLSSSGDPFVGLDNLYNDFSTMDGFSFTDTMEMFRDPIGSSDAGDLSMFNFESKAFDSGESDDYGRMGSFQ